MNDDDGMAYCCEGNYGTAILVTNSLLVVSKGWIHIGDCFTARPFARTPNRRVGFGLVGEHQPENL